MNGEVTNNSVEDRRQALTQRLGEARRHLHLFDLGVMLYAIGENDAAIECFDKFLTQYPSREVFNNLGLCSDLVTVGFWTCGLTVFDKGFGPKT